MGCITSTRQITIYHKDVYPECINLTFNFDKGLLRPEMQIKNFDDNELLKSAKAFHIERLLVFFNKYICGISVVYKLDGKNKKVEHFGSTCSSDTQFEKMFLEEFEHIEQVISNYSQRGLHGLTFKTNTGRSIACEGHGGKGNQTRELNLREHNKAIIGFRGLYSTHMLDFYIYISLRLDIISE